MQSAGAVSTMPEVSIPLVSGRPLLERGGGVYPPLGLPSLPGNQQSTLSYTQLWKENNYLLRRSATSADGDVMSQGGGGGGGRGSLQLMERFKQIRMLQQQQQQHLLQQQQQHLEAQKKEQERIHTLLAITEPVALPSLPTKENSVQSSLHDLPQMPGAMRCSTPVAARCRRFADIYKDSKSDEEEAGDLPAEPGVRPLSDSDGDLLSDAGTPPIDAPHDVSERSDASSEMLSDATDDGPTAPPGDDDERLIRPSGAQSFMELVELKLKEQDGQPPTESVAKSTTLPKRSFLRKGAGLERFGMGRRPTTVAVSRPGRQPPAKTSATKPPLGDLRTRKLRLDDPRNEKPPSGRGRTEAGRPPSLATGRPPSLVAGRPPGLATSLRLLPMTRKSAPPESEGGRENVVTGSERVAPAAVRMQDIAPPTGRETKASPSWESSPGMQEQDVLSSMELDFRRPLQEAERNQQIEVEDIEEFEGLERAADDNISLSSNCSLVVRMLTRARENSQQATVRHLAAVGEDQVTTPPSPDLDESLRDLDDTLTNQTSADDGEVRTRVMKRFISRKRPSDGETACRGGGSHEVAPAWEIRGPTDELPHVDQSDAASCSDGQSERLFEADVESDAEADISDGLSDIVNDGNDNDEHRASEGEVAAGSAATDYAVTAQHRDSFSDSSSWGETSTVAMANLDNSSLSEAADASETASAFTAPAMLFSNLRKPPVQAHKHTPTSTQMVFKEKVGVLGKIPIGEGAQVQLLKEKLAELEREIETFRAENAQLEAVRSQHHLALKEIQRERAVFEEERETALAEIEAMRETETRRLRRERKLFDEHQRAVRAVPDKREREEIQELRNQLGELRVEMQRREGRWSSGLTRARERTASLERENAQLSASVAALERARLDARPRPRPARPPRAVPAAVPPPPLPAFSDVVVLTDAAGGVAARSLPASPSRGRRRRRASPPHERDSGSRSSGSEDGEAGGEEDVGEGPEEEEEEEEPRGRLADEVRGGVVNGNEFDVDGCLLSGDPGRGRATTSDPGKSLIDNPDYNHELVRHPDGKLEKVFENGCREIQFPNGTRKEVSGDGRTVLVSFFNGDTKRILANERVVYYYADAQTIHTTFADGLQTMEFPNGQTERHYPDGIKEITYPDHTLKVVHPGGGEESYFPDGTSIKVHQDGVKVIEFSNGQKEIHTKDYKRREYPDGTTKTVYGDGRTETRYWTGRVRVKDKEGNVVVSERA